MCLGWSQGRVVMGMFFDGLWFVCQQVDDFEMWGFVFVVEVIGVYYIQFCGCGKVVELFE